ncbi:hypothetical protein [Meridianimarinicoccus aquatilis]|uniref:Uncharacterized protein n=1 Tax=Meridianimarinicoccus aquatilis TaxID=2552766 RepID=A0A4R6B1V4_9RHOB|nr:hypothetical protein [Fluviibacterium aquatile]QIE40633.1 hypothetical protein G5B39_00795 [Rhodobacteraceae bacterium SC52]TDL91141.1 hypothetical protein E2L05_02400 [Fluviibacterium aquatile]
MLKRISIMLGVLAVLLGSGFVLNKVAAVTIDDVASHFSLGRTQATVGVSGGDIYAIAPDGLSETRLCSLQLQEDFVTRVRIEAKFSNTIGSTLPFLVKFVSFGADEDIAGASDFSGARMRFSGEFTELQANAPMGAPADCEQKMAQFMNRRHKICMVRSSLVPTNNAVFSAYRFDRLQMFLPDSIFAMHKMEKSDAAKELQTQPCPQSSAVPWDVAFRKSLRVINMEDITDT